MKYGFRDYRGGGRSSARETAMRVAAGAIAKKVPQRAFGHRDTRACYPNWYTKKPMHLIGTW